MDYLALDLALVRIKKKQLLWKLEDGKISPEEFAASDKKLDDEYADARKAIRESYNNGTHDEIRKKQERLLKALEDVFQELKDLKNKRQGDIDNL